MGKRRDRPVDSGPDSGQPALKKSKRDDKVEKSVKPDVGKKRKQRTESDEGNRAPLKKSKSAAAPPEEDFPRGGHQENAATLTPLELLQTRRQVEQDLLFDTNRTEEPVVSKKSGAQRKKKKAKQKKGDDEPEDVAGDVEVDNLTFKKLSVGFTMLAAVRDVRDLGLIISLPDNLSGNVAITEISDPFTKALDVAAASSSDEDEDEGAKLGPQHIRTYFKSGDLLVCAVIALDTTGAKKKIELSVNPKRVNAGLVMENILKDMALWAVVTSVEDHGYVLSFGVDDVCTGFCSVKDARGFKGSEERLTVGQPLLCVVSSVNAATRVVKVACADNRVSTAQVGKTGEVSFEMLRPGMSVEAAPIRASPRGLVVTAAGSIPASIDEAHTQGIRLPEAETDAPKIKNLRARVLYIDNETKTVGLTANTNLVSWQPYVFPPDVVLGTIVEEAEVRSIDDGLGVLVSVPSSVGPLPGFVHISRVSDGRVDQRLSKKFKVGTTVKARVVGFSHLDGVVNLTTAKGIIEQPIMTLSDVKPGDKVKGKIVSIQPYGLLVELVRNVKGLVPLTHLADVPISKPEHKFKVDMEITCRVLTVDPTTKRVSLTRKKTMVGSELPRITAYEDAEEGIVSHGVITAVRDFGCIVAFYNEVHGIVPLSELSTEFVKNPADYFRVGQPVAARVLKVNPAKQEMRLSFNLTPSARDNRPPKVEVNPEALAEITPGLVVRATVTFVNEKAIHVTTESGVAGFVPRPQVSDYAKLIPSLMACYPVDTVVEAVVLERNEETGMVVLSMKRSLIAAATAEQLPASIADVRVGQVVAGYVKTISDFGVFVGVAGGLSGLAPMKNLSEAYVKDATEVFQLGQSVRGVVEQVEEDKGRFVLSLSAPAAFSTDASFLEGFLAERAMTTEAVRASRENVPRIGDSASAAVKVIKDFGVIMDMGSGRTGFATKQQAQGATALPGATLTGRVLDYDPEKDIADLSLRPETVSQAADTKKSKKDKTTTRPLTVGETVEVNVELIKDDYVVVSVPARGNLLAFAPSTDYNKASLKNQFGGEIGRKYSATVCAPANAEANLPALVFVAMAGSSGTKRKQGGKKGFETELTSVEDVQVGQTVKAMVISVEEIQMNLALGRHIKGRIHITEVPLAGAANPFEKYKVNDVVEARVLSIYDRESAKFLPISHNTVQAGTGRKAIELTLMPEDLAMPEGELAKPRLSIASLKKGDAVKGFVQQVTADCIWLALSPTVRGRVFILDVSDDLDTLKNVKEHFQPGQMVNARVLSVDNDRHSLDLSIKAAAKGARAGLEVGKIVPGRVSKMVPATGLYVQLSSHSYGRAFPTDLRIDEPTLREDPLEGFESGQYVLCKVLGVDKIHAHTDLAILSSRDAAAARPVVRKASDLKAGQVVSGYVKATSAKGCFVNLGQGVTAMVLISNLSDQYIKDVAKSFPPLKLVTGRVTGIDGDGRVSMTLKASEVQDGVKPALTFGDLKKGMKVSGSITKVETYGVFIRIDGTRLSGLCHISALSDEHVADVSKLYSVGDVVKAAIVKVDTEKKRISFGLKRSLFTDDDAETGRAEEPAAPVVKAAKSKSRKGKEAAEEEEEEDDGVDEEDVNEFLAGSGDEVDDEEDDDDDDEGLMARLQREEMEAGNFEGSEEGEGEMSDEADDEMEDEHPVNVSGRSADSGVVTFHPRHLKQSAAAAAAAGEEDGEEYEEDEGYVPGKSGPALQTKTGFVWDTSALTAGSALDGNDSDAEEDESDAEDDGEVSRNKKKRAAKAKRKEEEAKIRAKEAQMLEGEHKPETAADFERILLGSPNSSYLWINFMAFQLSLTEIDKARAIGRRALKTISFREEAERLNVWVALMNLENMHGTKESLLAVFHEACSSVDPLKVHMQLASILERANKLDMAETAYKNMCKAFKDNTDVWKRYCAYVLGTGTPEAARGVLQRALQALPKNKHVYIICQFALLEFKSGDHERGRTMFEEILAQHPKRTDIWSVYIDQEARRGDIEATRRIYERVTTLSLSVKKMKAFFTRFLAFEEENGTEESQDRVRERAREYMQTKMK